VLPWLLAIGLGGVALTVAFVLGGLREERAWLRETLDLGVGVSAGESGVVQQLKDLDKLLAPVAVRFGAEKRHDVERFLRLQAKLGIKRKARRLATDPALRQALTAQVDELHEEMDVLRRAVGVYCMAYVRSILPAEGEPLWARMEDALAADREPQVDLWKLADGRARPPKASPAGPTEA
jgi:hypothetical protein